MVRKIFLPGKSQNDRSATSLPLICKDIQLLENVTSLASRSISELSRNWQAGVQGLRIACCALRIRSSTSDLSKMTLPNRSLRAWPRVCPRSSDVKRRVTIHCHGSVEDVSRHSVGQLSVARSVVWQLGWYEDGCLPCACPTCAR